MGEPIPNGLVTWLPPGNAGDQAAIQVFEKKPKPPKEEVPEPAAAPEPAAY
ncbi:MAG: hypothetical protein GDA43_22805 [Hormoscilla sp. SP5CHS1]|nr:hypothetical protein [Hormoscilla sp. SP12CHS1]MBC6455659.1 hypothetical protein [Hormoscilla sp. SP5CHS1]MBC6472090.1 hypothetical protein [Hormoscilla sp. GM102CHS1]